MVEHSPACGSLGDFPTHSAASDGLTAASDGLTQDIPFFQKSHYGKWRLMVSPTHSYRILTPHF
jgi:hypothetical protein